MKTRSTMSISLPAEMIAEVERVRKAEHRTRSELIREALRVYFNRVGALPVYTPSARELREIEKGRREMARGEYLTADELFRGLGRRRGKARAKGNRTRS